MYKLKIIIIFTCLIGCNSSINQDTKKILRLLNTNHSDTKITAINDCEYSIILQDPPLEGIGKIRWSFDLQKLRKITMDTVSSNIVDIFLHFNNTNDITTEILDFGEEIDEKDKTKYQSGWYAVPVYQVPNNTEIIVSLKRMAKKCGASFTQN